MKELFSIGFLLFSFQLSFSQRTDIKLMVDSLQYMKADTLDCSADLFWRIVAKGENAIPYLIDRLQDTTPTPISFKCKVGKLNVAEVAYFALDAIAFWPTAVITKQQFDMVDKMGCWSFYDYFLNNKYKPEYQKLIKDWYLINNNKFYRVEFSKKQMNTCLKKYKIQYYLRWKE